VLGSMHANNTTTTTTTTTTPSVGPAFAGSGEIQLQATLPLPVLLPIDNKKFIILLNNSICFLYLKLVALQHLQCSIEN